MQKLSVLQQASRLVVTKAQRSKSMFKTGNNGRRETQKEKALEEKIIPTSVFSEEEQTGRKKSRERESLF